GGAPAAAASADDAVAPTPARDLGPGAANAPAPAGSEGQSGAVALGGEAPAPPSSAGEPGASPALAPPLPRSTPEAEGLSSEGVPAGWWARYTPDDIHGLYSVTKSFNATAVGIAADEGLLSIDDLVVSHFLDRVPAAPDPGLAQMRVRDLLTMSTGHEVDSIE